MAVAEGVGDTTGVLVGVAVSPGVLVGVAVTRGVAVAVGVDGAVTQTVKGVLTLLPSLPSLTRSLESI